MSVKAVGKRIAQALLPASAFAQLMSVRSRNYQRKFLRESGVLERTERYLHAYGLAVRRGPFQGMLYTGRASAERACIPRLVGSFEAELHPVIGQALRTPYELMVDIGSAEGYYTTGFALKGCSAHVVGYEIEPRERALAAEMAATNGVKIELRGACRPRDLRELAGKRAFVLSDCEGAELELFTAETLPALAHCDLLIELHGEAAATLPSLFAGSHSVAMIAQAPRDPADYPELSIFPAHEREAALSEYRGQAQRWLWARSHPEQVL
jgi:hypothetical protein